MSYPTQSKIEEALISLIYFRGGSDCRIKSSDAYQPLADYFQLTEQERIQPRESENHRPAWNNMVQFARRGLKDSGYLFSNSPRSIWQLSSSGIVAAQTGSHKHRELQTNLSADKPEKVVIESILINHPQPISKLEPDISNISITEGRKKLFIHIRRERNPKIVKEKKERVLNATGKLICEVCNFDFVSLYGHLGHGFCEVHHKNPLAKVDKETQTSLEDLAIVCSNCHRMIHRSQPMMDINQLKSILKNLDGIE